MIVLYDTKDYDLPKFVFNTYKEMAKCFNSTINSIQCAVCRKQLIKRRYIAVMYKENKNGLVKWVRTKNKRVKYIY